MKRKKSEHEAETAPRGRLPGGGRPALMMAGQKGGGETVQDKIQKALEEQLQLLSKRSEESVSDNELCNLTEKMIRVCEFLRACF